MGIDCRFLGEHDIEAQQIATYAFSHLVVPTTYPSSEMEAFICRGLGLLIYYFIRNIYIDSLTGA